MPIASHCSCKNRACELTKPLHSNLYEFVPCRIMNYVHLLVWGPWTMIDQLFACPDLALWRYCWRYWAKVSGRSMKKLYFSRHETFIIEQEIMLASLGNVWFDEVTHPHKRSLCQKMSKEVHSTTKIHSSIITHLLHLLPLNALLGPVFLDKPRDWPCIGTLNSTKLGNMGM